MLQRLTKSITVVVNGETYSFHPGDVVEPDQYGIPAKYFATEHADKMVRSAVKKDEVEIT